MHPTHIHTLCTANKYTHTHLSDISLQHPCAQVRFPFWLLFQVSATEKEGTVPENGCVQDTQLIQ